MELYPKVPRTFSPSAPSHDLYLGRVLLPLDVVREIYDWVLAADTTGVVLPHPVDPVGAHPPGLTGKAPGIYITSRCPLLRTCKASRSLYHSMLSTEILYARYQHLQVLVQDFDFTSVVHGLINPVTAESEQKSNDALLKLKQHPFTIRLKWSTNFLQTFTEQHLDTWLAYRNDIASPGSTTRNWRYSYATDKISVHYLDLFGCLADMYVYERWGEMGPEARAIFEDIGRDFASGDVKMEGKGAESRGKWVKGRWVVWLVGEAEPTEEDYEDEDEGDGEI